MQQVKTLTQARRPGRLQARILIFHPDSETAEAIRAALDDGDAPIELEYARRPAEIEALLSEFRFDLLICPYTSEECDWREVLALTRRPSRHREPPPAVIVLADEVGQREAVQCIRSGVCDLIPARDLWRLPAVVIREIADRRLVREHRAVSRVLAESERRYEKLLNLLPAGVLGVNAEGRITYVNKEFARMVAREPRELLGRASEELSLGFDEETRDFFSTTGPAIVERERTFQMRRPDGSSVTVRLDWSYDYNMDGAILGVIAVFTDISARVEAERELSMSERRFEALFEGSPDAIVLSSVDGILLDVNQSCLDVFAYRLEDVIGHSVHELEVYTDPEDREELLEMLQGGGRVVNHEVEMNTADGHIRIMNWSVQMLELEESRYLMWVGRDVTDERRAQRMAEHQQRLEAMGELAGGIAHDFNNLLTVILGYADLSKQAAAPESPVGRYASEIFTAGNRARKLIRRILTFSSHDEESVEPTDVRGVLKENLHLVQASAPSNVIFGAALEGTGWVLSSATRLGQVFLNILTNAVQALGSDGGRIGVALETAEVGGARAEELGLEKGSYVVVSISDNGPGIPDHVRDRMFEPYFTTKRGEEGTGLGLSVVHGIVESMSGSIRLRSEAGRGTTFILFLPAYSSSASTGGESGGDDTKIGQGGSAAGPEAHARPRTAGARATAAGAKPRTARIAVVDDEPDIARVVRLGLSYGGHEVTAFTDAERLLTVLRAKYEKFDLLVVDAHMHGKSGAELVRELRKLGYEIPVVCLDGEEAPVRSGYFADPRVVIAHKPVDTARLRATVEELLLRTGARPDIDQ